jgi:hypothetical protein
MIDRDHPYPGLRPFDYADAELFFGREDEILEILDRLETCRFLAVVGSSGSGKSSLVRAGVLPGLQTTLEGDPKAPWKIAMIQPRNNPLGELAVGLQNTTALGPEVRNNGQSNPWVQATLRQSPMGLLTILRRASLPSDSKLLIFVDQFEELFRFAQEGGAGENDARAFVKLLLESAAQDQLPVYVLLTMRTEFLGACTAYPGLPEAITNGIYLVPQMGYDQVRLSITEPAAAAGSAVSERLVNRLINDMGEDQDRLPLLQHVLMRLWSDMRSDQSAAMDLENYARVGRVGETLNQHANEIYDGLPPTLRNAAEQLFRQITTVSQGQTVRRPRTLEQLEKDTGIGQTELKAVIEKFRMEGTSFLTPSQDKPLERDTVIDISHESLIRKWQKLRNWAAEEEQRAGMFRLLHDNAADWARNGRPRGDLYRNPRLHAVMRAIVRSRWTPSPVELEFLHTSVRWRLMRNAIWSMAVALVILIPTFYLGREAYDQYAGKLETAQQKANFVEGQFKASKALEQLTPVDAKPSRLIPVTVETPESARMEDFQLFTRLGLDLIVKPAQQEPNCLWYGAAITKLEYRAAVLALIRQGVAPKGLFPYQPTQKGAPRSMRIGYRAASANQPDMTAEEVTTDYVLYTHYQNAADAAIIDELIGHLTQLGHTIPGKQLVNQQTTGDVRYFRAADGTAATRIAIESTRFLRMMGRRIVISPLDDSKIYPHIPTGHLELWIPALPEKQ